MIDELLMLAHAVTHQHYFAPAAGGMVKSCKWRVPFTQASFGYRPDFAGDCPWYWVPADLVQPVFDADNAYAAMALLRARYAEMAAR